MHLPFSLFFTNPDIEPKLFALQHRFASVNGARIRLPSGQEKVAEEDGPAGSGFNAHTGDRKERRAAGGDNVEVAKEGRDAAPAVRVFGWQRHRARRGIEIAHIVVHPKKLSLFVANQLQRFNGLAAVTADEIGGPALDAGNGGILLLGKGNKGRRAVRLVVLTAISASIAVFTTNLIHVRALEAVDLCGPQQVLQLRRVQKVVHHPNVRRTADPGQFVAAVMQCGRAILPAVVR